MEIFFLIGLFLAKPMIETTKYNFNFTNEAIIKNINRLTNQLWKLIPMRENNENWQNHLASLIVEIAGLGNIYNNIPAYISLLSKLEGLQNTETEFFIYRKVVFETISLLREIIK